MTITDAHKLVAAALGEMAFAIGRREAPEDKVREWIRRLRLAADGLEKRLKEGP